MRYQAMRFPEGRAKAVTFSYDDGGRQDIRLAKLFTQYGLKATFNLNGDALRKGSGLTKEEVETYLLSAGHEIAVHGNFHRAPGMLRPIEGIREVLDCRMELEQKYGRIIRGMAYPDSGVTLFDNGATYSSIKNYLTELDIAYARSLRGDNDSFLLPEDFHQWIPTAYHKNPLVLEYADRFLALDLSKSYISRRYPRLFYVWGHSYEFDNDNNWDLIEEICKKFADRDDVWAATNIEIYDYVQAYRNLVYSADGRIIYNPTLRTLWFTIDGKDYTIYSGETLYI